MIFVLADTSIWADHFRRENPLLQEWIAQKRIWMHPLVVHELAMGNLPTRQRTLAQLWSLNRAVHARDEEVAQMVESKRLYGNGLSWIDAHLLASTILSKASLWTRDKRLRMAAEQLGCAVQLHH